MVATNAKSERIDMRLSKEHKDLIEEAAALAGVTTTALATEALLQHAQAVIEQAKAPPIIARKPKRAKSERRSGTKPPMPPI